MEFILENKNAALSDLNGLFICLFVLIFLFVLFIWCDDKP